MLEKSGIGRHDPGFRHAHHRRRLGQRREDGLIADIDEWLKTRSFRPDYRHHRTGETNGDSHLKSLLASRGDRAGTAGKLDFGPWQQVYYAEFDGQRPKRVIIKAMGE